MERITELQDEERQLERSGLPEDSFVRGKCENLSRKRINSILSVLIGNIVFLTPPSLTHWFDFNITKIHHKWECMCQFVSLFTVL